MYKPMSPCKGCKDRIPENPDTGAADCHKSCEKYIAFKKRVAEYNKIVKTERADEKRMIDIQWTVFHQHNHGTQS